MMRLRCTIAGILVAFATCGAATAAGHVQERWEGNDTYASYEIFPTPGNDNGSDENFATVMRVRCDGMSRSGLRYLAGFGVTAEPYFGEVQIGLPITVVVDGIRHRHEAVRDEWDREGAVHAIFIWTYDPLWEALQAGRSATIYFGSTKIRTVDLTGSRKALSGISEC